MSSHAHAQAKPASSPAPSFTPAPSRLLQRKCACGGTPGVDGMCESCRQKRLSGVQTKLVVNKPGDRYEQEADRIADQVMRMPNPAIQRQDVPEEEDEDEILQMKPLAAHITPLVQRETIDEEEEEEEIALQRQSLTEEDEDEEELLQARRADAQVPTVTPSVEAAVRSVRQGGGQPLDPATRAFMESRLGHDFSLVRVHANTVASRATNAVNARAFTVGSHIALGRETSSLIPREHEYLMAHELVHVIQQGAAKPLSSNTSAPISKHVSSSSQTAHVQRMVDDGISRYCREDIGFPECRLSSKPITGVKAQFDVNCNTFRRPQDLELIRSSARGMIRGGLTGFDVEIHGFASDDGPAEFNQRVSCARAQKAEVVMLLQGLPANRIQDPFAHGGQPGQPDEERSVGLRFVRRGVQEQDEVPVDTPEPEEAVDVPTIDIDTKGDTSFVDVVLDAASVADTISTIADVSGTFANVLGAAAPFLSFIGNARLVGNRMGHVAVAVESRGYAYGLLAEAAGVDIGAPSQGGTETKQSFSKGVGMGREAFRSFDEPKAREIRADIAKIHRNKQAMSSVLNSLHEQIIEATLSEKGFFGLIPATSPIGVQEQDCQLFWPGPRWSGTCVTIKF